MMEGIGNSEQTQNSLSLNLEGPCCFDRSSILKAINFNFTYEQRLKRRESLFIS